MRAGLTATEKWWPAIQQAYAWVHQAAHLLANAEQHEVDVLKREYQQLLATMAQQQDLLGTLAPAVAHFQKVTASYGDGLFVCYRVKDLPFQQLNCAPLMSPPGVLYARPLTIAVRVVAANSASAVIRRPIGK